VGWARTDVHGPFVTPPTQASTPVFAAATGMPSQPQICGGELGEDKSFYFRSPDGALNLQAQNLAFFLQIAEGIDDRTWLRHLRAGDYSQWRRDKIKTANPPTLSQALKKTRG
jgi:hypothetical protein